MHVGMRPAEAPPIRKSRFLPKVGMTSIGNKVFPQSGAETLAGDCATGLFQNESMHAIIEQMFLYGWALP